LYPYRCWDCDHRFFLRFDSGLSHRGQAERLAAREMEARNARREGPRADAQPGFTRREILLFAAGFLLVMGALSAWFVARRAF